MSIGEKASWEKKKKKKVGVGGGILLGQPTRFTYASGAVDSVGVPIP